jgi:iron(II)-dependent oxidoreductase
MLNRLKEFFRPSSSETLSTVKPLGNNLQDDLPGSALRPPSSAAQDPDLPSVDDPFQQMLQQGRSALLLRPQIAERLSSSQRAQTQQAFGQMASLVPAGPVFVEGWHCAELDGLMETLVASGSHAVDELFLDRYTVTNAQFSTFVKAGGYSQEALWNPSAWPRVGEFVDRGGCPGPRVWQSGAFARSEAEHPVVGVCWYEADAYARWVGKRLPTDAEWVKAASWPVAAEDGRLVSRRYPWGDTADPRKANLWNFGAGSTLPVDRLPSGVSVGGAHQLIGNVWEWTSSCLNVVEPRGRVKLERPLKIIRGGAFDTYFETQANCHFQSADALFARRHNLGFRCAISASEVATMSSPRRDSTQVQGENPLSQETSA